MDFNIGLDMEYEIIMRMETERLFLREMNQNDYDSLYAVLADSDIMQRKGYAKEAASLVRDWVFENTPFKIIFSYIMKYTTGYYYL